MNTVEQTMLKHIQDLELFMFNNCNTARDRDTVRETLDTLTTMLVNMIGARHIREFKKNG